MYNNPRTFKILLVGDSKVEKSNLLSRYTENSFRECAYIPTTNIDCKNKIISLWRGKAKLQMTDTPGDKKKRTGTKDYFKRHHAIIIVYDCTNRESFNSVNYWLDQASKSNINNALTILVGNKTDLDSEVSYQEASRFAKSNNLTFFETSCKDNEGINEVFYYIAEELLNQLGYENSEEEDIETISSKSEDLIVQGAIEKSFDDSEWVRKVKVIILGGPQSGKSSIWNRIMENGFNSAYRPTIGVEFAIKTYLYKEEKLNVEFWDTAGKDKYRPFIKSYITSASVAILVYDCMNKKSFFGLKKSIKDFKDIDEADIKIIIIGNKSDKGYKIISTAHVKALADYLGAKYFEISCKNEFSSTEIITELLSQANEKRTFEKSTYSRIQKFIKLTKKEKFDEKCSIFKDIKNLSPLEKISTITECQKYNPKKIQKLKALFNSFIEVGESVYAKVKDFLNERKSVYSEVKDFIKLIWRKELLKKKTVDHKLSQKSKGKFYDNSREAIVEFKVSEGEEYKRDRALKYENTEEISLNQRVQENKRGQALKYKQLIENTEKEIDNIIQVANKQPVQKDILVILKKQCDHLFKIFVAGDSKTGKTSLIDRYTNNSFSESFRTTIGLSFKIKTIELQNLIIRLQMWDFSGSEKLKTMTGTCYKGADGVILVFDCTNKDSFDNLDNWRRLMEMRSERGASVILVGTKTDLDSKRVVSSEQAWEYAEINHLKYFEISSKNNQGITEMFETLTRDILRDKY